MRFRDIVLIKCISENHTWRLLCFENYVKVLFGTMSSLLIP
jgi:hypothetical protein